MSTLKVGYAFQSRISALQTSDRINPPYGVFFPSKIFAGVPEQYSFKEGYPNPFNPATHIQYDLPAAGSVSLLILDIQGREVKTLQAGFVEAGSYGVTWNAADQATGVYFARLVVTDQSGKAVYTKTNKLLLTK